MPNMKHIFITGATSGLGKAAALQLASDGAVVIAASRNPQKGASLLADYREKFPKGKGRIELVECDLGSLASVSMACEEISESYDHLDMIINNAGIMIFERSETRDKIEATWQVNLLSPMLIAHLLVHKFKTSTEPKLIFTTSGLHKGTIDFEDPEYKNKKFVGYKSYSQSKLGVILMTRLLAQQLSEEEIGVYTQHPGLVDTNLSRSAGAVSKFIFNRMGTTPEKGAETLLYLATTPSEDLISGEYYTKKHVAQITKESYDLDMAEKLLELVKDYLKKYITEASLIFP
jgi:NAD(P)-dependent dehydrogenase (short-subunit alcohol dehydrogenase family)